MRVPVRTPARSSSWAAAAVLVAALATTVPPDTAEAAAVAGGGPRALPPPAVVGADLRPWPHMCASDVSHALAERMERGLREVLRDRSGTVAFDVSVPRYGLRCRVRPTAHYDAASVVKLLLMETTLNRAESAGRDLTTREEGLLHAMITRSDNSSASVLWGELGHDRLRGFLDAAGARDTTLGPGGLWGLTRTSAADQLRLLDVLDGDADSPVEGRGYALGLLRDVREDQRWGVSAGAPRGVRVQLKNGWLPRPTHGWRVHSAGSFTGGTGGPYGMAVLTSDNSTKAAGVRMIERLAAVVHRHVASGRSMVSPSAHRTTATGSPGGGLPGVSEVPRDW